MPDPDPIQRVLLGATSLSQEQKAAAWDAVMSGNDDATLQQRLGSLDIPQSVKADLWDAKKAVTASKGASPEMNFAIVNGKKVPLGADEADIPGMGAASRFASGYGRGTGLGVIGSLINTLADTPQNLQRELGAAGEAFKKGDAIGGILHTGAAVPVAGPLARGMVESGVEQINRGGEAFKQGNDVAGAIHTGLGFLMPAVGPVLGAGYDRGRSGDIAGQLGESAGILTTEMIPHALPLLPKNLFRSRDAERAALIDRMIQQGYPMDLATASGMPMVQVMQRVGSEGLVGSLPTAYMNARDEAIYKTKADQLANEAAGTVQQGPLPKGQTAFPNIEVTPIQAGTQVAEKLRESQQEQFKAGSEQYETAEFKAGMANPESVKLVQDFDAGKQARAEHTLGRKIKPEEVPELQRILQEMEAMPNTKNIWTPTEGSDRGNTPSGQYTITGGGAGAHVFDRINAAMPARKMRDAKTGEVSFQIPEAERREVITSLKRALTTGHFTGPAVAAMSVVEERLANRMGAAERSAELPRSAGDILKEVQVPVDPTEAQDSLRGDFQNQLEVMKLENSSAQPGMKALIGFMREPNSIGLMQLEEVLSNFKSIVRGGEEVRTPGARMTPDQLLASKAVAAIEPILKEKAATVPGLLEALEQGRAHWAEGFKIKQTADQIGDISVSAAARFNKLSGPLGTELLQNVQKIRPDAIADIAKAKLDQINEKAFSGAPNGPSQAFTEFKAIEPESLKILFPEKGHAEALRDLYETMALRAHNVNPSGSMLGAGKVAEVGTVLGLLGTKIGEGTGLMAARGTPYAGYAALSSLMLGAMGIAGHSSTVTKLLLEGGRIPLKNAAAVAAWSRRLEMAMDEANSRKFEDRPGPRAGFAQGDISLPAQGARDPRLPPP